MRNLFLRWIAISVAVFVAANISFLGIGYDNWQALVVAAMFLSVANTFVRPVLLLISLPLILFSFGIFILVVNALIFEAAGAIVKGFHVSGFWSALGGSIVVSIVSLLLGVGNRRFRVERGFRSQRTPPPGKGPIIDI